MKPKSDMTDFYIDPGLELHVHVDEFCIKCFNSVIEIVNEEYLDQENIRVNRAVKPGIVIFTDLDTNTLIKMECANTFDSGAIRYFMEFGVLDKDTGKGILDVIEGSVLLTVGELLSNNTIH